MIINIDEKELQKLITEELAKKIRADYSTERYVLKSEIAQAVRDIVYAEKDFIINMVVNRASTEIVKKALPKLLDVLKEGK